VKIDNTTREILLSTRRDGDVMQGQTKTSRRVQPGVQDDASRRAGLQNGNPRDYCTYKRFTVCGPFAEPKGGRGRYGNRQTEASTYPSISPDASRRPRHLSLSLRQVILLRHPAASTSPSTTVARPFFLLVFLSLCISSRSLCVVVSSIALQSFKHRCEPLRSVIPSLSRFFPVEDRISDGRKNRRYSYMRHRDKPSSIMSVLANTVRGI